MRVFSSPKSMFDSSSPHFEMKAASYCALEPLMLSCPEVWELATYTTWDPLHPHARLEWPDVSWVDEKFVDDFLESLKT